MTFPQYLGGAALYRPIDHGVWKRSANGGEGRQSMNYVADRTELY